MGRCPVVEAFTLGATLHLKGDTTKVRCFECRLRTAGALSAGVLDALLDMHVLLCRLRGAPTTAPATAQRRRRCWRGRSSTSACRHAFIMDAQSQVASTGCGELQDSASSEDLVRSLLCCQNTLETAGLMRCDTA